MAANGIKHLGAFFPNEMMAVSSPNFLIRSYKRVLCGLRRHRANKVYSSAAIAAHSCGTRGNLNSRRLVVNFLLFSVIKMIFDDLNIHKFVTKH